MNELRAGDKTPRLLLHSCCAPCSSYVLEYLREVFAVTVLFYNPNITEPAEYERRKAEELRLIELYNRQVTKQAFENMHSTPQAKRIDVLDCDHDAAAFLTAAAGLESCPEGGERCTACYALRLKKTAEMARAGGFDFFTTTLSISPHKDATRINAIGENLARQEGVAFLPSDFKKNNGYLRSIALSAQFDLYRQDYCGCVYSRQQAKDKRNEA